VSGLAEVAVLAGPLAMTMAIAGTGARVRSIRRRREVDRALHELRRPLQALALTGPRSGDPAAATPAELALDALENLDAALDGTPPRRSPRPVAARALVSSAVERWRGPAARAGKALGLRWEAGSVSVHADPLRLGRALDNLLANAIDHGGLRVSVCARVLGSRIRVEISDRGSPDPRARRRRFGTGRGHGLPIVAGIAREHGGRLALARSQSGSIAILELPVVQ
jgi:signal transduction histidine kinase